MPIPSFAVCGVMWTSWKVLQFSSERFEHVALGGSGRALPLGLRLPCPARESGPFSWRGDETQAGSDVEDDDPLGGRADRLGDRAVIRVVEIGVTRLRRGEGGVESPLGQRVSRRGVEVARALAPLAQERGLTQSQFALLWCKAQPGVTSPIIGPRTMEQLDDALQVLELRLADQDRARLDELVGPGNAVSDFHNSNNWMRARIAE
jgi:hypothetical protein